MKIAYLILAHNNPQHLQRLIAALQTENSQFFVHIDKKTKIKDFLFLESGSIRLIKNRTKVTWGCFSQVQAILNLIDAAISVELNYDYLVLLSGADYPIQSSGYIEQFLESKNGAQFMNIVQMPCDKAGKPLSRFQGFQPEFDFRGVRRWLHRTLLKLNFIKTKDFEIAFRNLVPYGGCTWWVLTLDACKYISNYTRQNPKFVQFYKNTICPDESFFQTILGNSTFSSSFQRNLTYTDWSNGGNSPANITLDHISKLKAFPKYFIKSPNYGEGECLFARKFVGDTNKLVEAVNINIATHLNHKS